MKKAGSLKLFIIALVAILAALVEVSALTTLQPAQAKAEANRIIPETISAGAYHACGVKSDGTLACRGNNYYNQTNAPGGIFTQVSAGYSHTCGAKSDGWFTCWGQDDYGQSSPYPHRAFLPLLLKP
jgi:alpha-tubulin suppressor-like RCC1 family protein